MKILYGVQGTGNGHITRARMMARHFRESDVDVTYLFSGRSPEQFFDMECFGDYLHRKGLTFVTDSGCVRYGKTLFHNNLLQFAYDIASLNISDYDIILTDFEPVTAWAGKLRGKQVIGVGHQYAFGEHVPKAGENFIAKTVMKLFAPVSLGIGYHWHHFGHENILPPVIDNHLPGDKSENFFVVYLPFEHQRTVTTLLNCLDNYQFVQYSPELTDSRKGNVQLRKTCHDGFKKDLSRCQGVICNAGFELVSECLNMQLPLLVKPVNGQMEQLSNAAALQQLGFATTINQLDVNFIANWLDSHQTPPALRFPNVAEAVVEWLTSNRQETVAQLAQKLWQQPANNISSLSLQRSHSVTAG